MVLSDTCIKRPVFATVLSLIILIVGLVSYERLPVREYPQIDEPVVSVSTTYAGAAADVIESQVTKPLEDSISGIEGVELMTSTSRSERSNINVRFRLGRDPDAAAAEVRDKVSRVRRNLPDEVDEPVIAKVEADSQPIIYIAVESGTMNQIETSDYINRYIKPRLSVLPGAAEVRVFGERLPSMRIDVDRDKLASYGLTVQDVETALRAQNVEIPAGRIESLAREFSVVADTGLSTPAQFRDIVLTTVGGYPVRIGDVASVMLGPKDERVQSRFNGAPAVNIGLVRQSTANPLELSQAARAEIETINNDLPAGMRLNLSYDSSVFIEESIKSVYKTILEAVVLVVVVIVFFLRSLRASIIPIVTIPVSLIGACAIMYALGFSINTLTLLAMVLAIGLVVDDAIVVLENVYRHIEEGVPRMQAALRGSREIAFAVIAMTLTLITVYAPLAFATGRTGRLFIEFALTLASAVLLSGFVALTLTPMMCSVLLRHESGHGRIYNAIERILERLTTGYRRLLRLALRHRAPVLVLGLAVAGSMVLLLRVVPSELAPTEDRGAIFSRVFSPEGATVDYTIGYLARAEQFYQNIPERAAFQSTAGFPTVTDGTSVLRLKPWGERDRKQQDIANELRPQFASLPGVRTVVSNPPSLGQSARASPVEFVLLSQMSYPELAGVADRFMAELANYPGLRNLNSDLRLNTPELRVEVNRERIADVGADVAVVGRTLETMLGGRQVTRFNSDGEQYDVMVRVTPSSRAEPADIAGIYVRTRGGEMVQLANLLDVREAASPQSLNHFNRLRSAKIEADLAPGYSLGDVLPVMYEVAARVLPETVQTDLDGQAREFRDSSGSIYLAFGMALVFIYLVLAAQFESWRNPFVIMMSVPLSLTGGLLALWLSGGTLSIYSQIGLITLLGLITKHGILIVEFTNQLREQGHGMLDAVIEASVLRLRPILMTTGAMVLGAVPLALAVGAGAESRQQIGWVIVGGLSVGTLLTLFVVPVVYTLIAPRRMRHRFVEEPAVEPAPAIPPPVPPAPPARPHGA
ncbi:efflux RND transporter permease subunit [Verticiella sediminum]|uniref:Efflux RND transporter permease subunit n=1 Tax=Verticiella sediminum TaxID=1247510 RepID=A0A556ABV8_9BURK|nr:efflux RND transporter permease subunit [Verticiella sediminum]TSH90375.1 efflux RND transporter permease subunit [Verticiella sediminum]